MPGQQGMTDKLSVWLAQTVGASVHDVYNIDSASLLGVGTFGKVFKGVNKVSGQPCAIKQISKPPANQRSMVKGEIAVMQKLDHPNVIKFFDHFEDNVNDYLIMELCSGGKVINFLARMQGYRESDAALLMKQVLLALDYMHDKNIIHRDVKPDNMLLESWRPLEDNTLKLADFGLSCKCAPGGEVRLSAGTPDYISPQAIDGCYDSKTDMWSCGVSMYFLLCGYVPFRAQSEAGAYAAVKRGNFSFAASEWSNVSSDATDMIRLLLKLNPHERLSASDALNHVWLMRRAQGGHGVLQHAVANFGMNRMRRKAPQPEADMFTGMRSALENVSQWANSVLPSTKMFACSSLANAPNEQYEFVRYTGD